MKTIIKLAIRNIMRYKRRTLLTSSLITMGVALVIIFSGIGNSFNKEIIGILTESNLGDIQIHKKGYVSSIDNLPLDITIPEKDLKRIEKLLSNNPEVKAYSQRIKFGAMISNFTQTTNLKLTAVNPENESKTCPGLVKRIEKGNSEPNTFVKPGSVVIPLNIADGMNLKVGDDVVIIATNKDGSVNGMNFRISGISENILGPQGKDGYIHIDDAKSILRIGNRDITEIAVKLNNFNKLNSVVKKLKKDILKIDGKNSTNQNFEIHTWEELSPFASISKIVSLLIITIRIVLISIVLISILNVMMMSVYERIGEIGTIASIGTLPGKILLLFLSEGLTLGFFSAIAGNIFGALILLIISAFKLNFTFGMMELTLAPQIPIAEILFTLLIVIIISAFASLQPAIKASKMEPVEALRHV
ncbi:MAG: ABC transporter substrate-binding protein [Ignavibacteria bacterium GWB2_35_12]|nr:MAG: ABC transporter substrate-binding protein [Ignavibacteria bacterium GWB2_35_12]OGV21759.1 MAG: ABC transporter substrate-binding protein [Ignavibacteria bacterium RIFOXYC2_FULL_35_21]